MKEKYILGAIALSLILGVTGVWLSIGQGGAQKYGGTTSVDSLYLKGNLTVDGVTSMTGGVAQAGPLFVGGALSGSSTLAMPNGLSTLSSLTATGTTKVYGAATLYSTLDVPGGLATFSSLTATGTTKVYGAATLYSTLGVPAAATTLSSLTVTSTAAMYSTAAISGALTDYVSVTTPIVNATSSLVIGTGTSITNHLRGTQSLNPDSISGGGATTTAIAVTGAAAGDQCAVNSTDGDLLSTTSTVFLNCRASSGTITVYMRNASSTAAFDAGASTISVQAWRY